jgi:hypothetical protein
VQGPHHLSEPPTAALQAAQHQVTCLINGIPVQGKIGSSAPDGQSPVHMEYVIGQHDQPFNQSTLCIRWVGCERVHSPCTCTLHLLMGTLESQPHAGKLHRMVCLPLAALAIACQITLAALLCMIPTTQQLRSVRHTIADDLCFRLAQVLGYG